MIITCLSVMYERGERYSLIVQHTCVYITCVTVTNKRFAVISFEIYDRMVVRHEPFKCSSIKYVINSDGFWDEIWKEKLRALSMAFPRWKSATRFCNRCECNTSTSLISQNFN